MEMERLQSQIRYVIGDDQTQGLREQRAKEWEEYYRKMAEHARMVRYAAAPPSPQSPTGFVPFAPWSNQSPQQNLYRQAVGGASGVGPAVSGGAFHNY